MGLDQHLDSRDEVEEDGHAGEVDTDFAPAEEAIEDGREDGHRRRRVEDCRNSEPEQNHFDLHLKGVREQYTVMQITKRGP